MSSESSAKFKSSQSRKPKGEEYITIALDAMGGDYGCKVVVPAALAALKRYPELKLILVGRQESIEAQLRSSNGQEHERLTIFHANEIVEMDELPSHALRNKKDSSMRQTINLVKNGSA